jgi:hypothetical protein
MLLARPQTRRIRVTCWILWRQREGERERRLWLLGRRGRP